MKAHDLARLLLRRDNYEVRINLQPRNRASLQHAIGTPEDIAKGVVFVRDGAKRALCITNDVRALKHELEEAGVEVAYIIGVAAECAETECHKPTRGCPGCGASEAMCLSRFQEKGGKCCPDCNHQGRFCGQHASYRGKET